MPSSGSTVLLVRLLHFGDVLLTLPLAEALLASERVGAVDLLTSREFSTVVKRSGRFRKVYEIDVVTCTGDIDLANARYDYLLNLHARRGPFRAALDRVLRPVRATVRVGYDRPSYDRSLEPRRNDEHAVEFYARAAAGLVDAPLGTGVVAGGAELAVAAEFEGTMPANPVCLTPGARFEWKRWPARHYAELARSLQLHGVSPVVVGHPFDSELIEWIVERTPGVHSVVSDDEVRLLNVMSACGISVGNSSGLMHLAQVAGAKVVCVHSHTLPVMWRPWGFGHKDITGTDLRCDCVGVPDKLLAPCGQNIALAPVLEAVLALNEARSGQIPHRSG